MFEATYKRDYHKQYKTRVQGLSSEEIQHGRVSESENEGEQKTDENTYLQELEQLHYSLKSKL